MLHALTCFILSATSLQSCYHESVSTMHEFPLSLKPVHITCHVCIDAIIIYVDIWNKFCKGVLLSAFSTIMPWSCFLKYVNVACSLLALNIATWCCFCHAQWISAKSVKLLSFAFLPCCFRLVLAVAQCSWFVELHLYFTTMYSVFLFGCRSIFKPCI